MNIKLNNFFAGSNKRNNYYRQEKQSKNPSKQEKFEKEDPDVSKEDIVTFLDSPIQLKTNDIKTEENTTKKGLLNKLLKDDEHTQSICHLLYELIPKKNDSYNDEKINDILKLILNATGTTNPLKLSEALIQICNSLSLVKKLSDTNIHLLIQATSTIAKKNEDILVEMDTFTSEKTKKTFQTITILSLSCYENILKNKKTTRNINREDFIVILKTLKRYLNQNKKDILLHVINVYKSLNKAFHICKKQELILLVNSTIEELKIKHKSNSNLLLKLDECLR